MRTLRSLALLLAVLVAGAAHTGAQEVRDTADVGVDQAPVYGTDLAEVQRDRPALDNAIDADRLERLVRTDGSDELGRLLRMTGATEVEALELEEEATAAVQSRAAITISGGTLLVALLLLLLLV